MKTKKLPEPKFYTIHTLAEKWGCSEGSVLNYALTGQLQLSVESQGWNIEYGSIEEDEGTWFSIPEETKRSKGDLLRLSLRDQKDLVRNGVITDPSFQEEEYDYASASPNDQGSEVIIYLKDAVVDPVDADAVFDEVKESDEEEVSLEPTKIAEEGPRPRKAIDCVSSFYEEGIKIYGKILEDTGKDPSLKTVIHTLRGMPEFNVFPYETIKRHMNKKELILRFQSTKRG